MLKKKEKKKSFLSHFEQIYRWVLWLDGNEQFIEGNSLYSMWIILSLVQIIA